MFPKFKKTKKLVRHYEIKKIACDFRHFEDENRFGIYEGGGMGQGGVHN